MTSCFSYEVILCPNRFNNRVLYFIELIARTSIKMFSQHSCFNTQNKELYVSKHIVYPVLYGPWITHLIAIPSVGSGWVSYGSRLLLELTVSLVYVYSKFKLLCSEITSSKVPIPCFNILEVA